MKCGHSSTPLQLDGPRCCRTRMPTSRAPLFGLHVTNRTRHVRRAIKLLNLVNRGIIPQVGQSAPHRPDFSRSAWTANPFDPRQQTSMPSLDHQKTRTIYSSHAPPDHTITHFRPQLPSRIPTPLVSPWPAQVRSLRDNVSQPQHGHFLAS